MMIHFLPKYVRSVLSGKKRATVRLGRKGVKPGMTVYLAVGGRPFAKAKVVKVSHKKLKELSPEEIKKEGYSSFKELLRELREIYPVISPEDEVTYIEWRILEK
ncbi:MAG: ASCH domain-containing protein [Candidatus Diapherotrites archaeon]|nr:ASCH domain-containing protein [Candidatus Diapherotrites archaeon]